jgi:hypothetical protein
LGICDWWNKTKTNSDGYYKFEFEFEETGASRKREERCSFRFKIEQFVWKANDDDDDNG